MTTNKEIITVLTREEMFAKNCKIFDLRREYPGFDGKIFWAIATSYTNAELHAFYSDFIEPYEPFMLLSVEEGKAMTEYSSNEHKHEMRQKRHGIVFDFSDGETETHHSELQSDEMLDILLRQEDNENLYKAIKKLNEIQRRRIVKLYFCGMTIRDIASEEHTHFTSVQESILRGRKNLELFLTTPYKIPLSVHSSEGTISNPDRTVPFKSKN